MLKKSITPFINSILLYLIFSSNLYPSDKHLFSLSICTVFKDDAPFLVEWIEYHKLLGVEHFFLYNNDSSDDFREVLKPYLINHEVTLTDWPNKVIMKGKWVDEIQWTACIDAINLSKGVSKWLALIDTDEFIVPLKDRNITSFLEKYDDYAGVIINWQCFGTSYVKSLRRGQLLTETLTLKASEQSEWNYAVKSIVKPEFVDVSTQNWTPHLWNYTFPYKAVMPNKKEYCFGAVEVEDIQINHYVHRTEQYFQKFKIPKKERMEGHTLDKEYIKSWHLSCNQIEDKSIFRFISQMKNSPPP